MKNLKFLDGLRGIASLYVMIGHSRWLLWEGFFIYSKNPESYTFFEKFLVFFFSLFKYGHEAVMLFFVLSGFVIHLKQSKLLKINSSNAIDWKTYFIKRILRLYPPFLIALIIGFFLDSLGKTFLYPIYFSQTPYPLINENIIVNHEFATLIGNLFFLGSIQAPVWGSNGPLWSLSYEWWFYTLYPIFVFLGRKNIVLPTVLIILLFILSIYYNNSFFIFKIFSHFLAWWLGVILADLFIGRTKVSLKFTQFFCLVIFFRVFIKHPKVLDLVSSFFFMGLLGILLLLPKDNFIFKIIKKFKFFGDISYSLYITHFPVLVLFSGWLMNQNNGYLPKNQIFIPIGILLSLLTATLVYFFVEKPLLNYKNAFNLNEYRK